MKEKGLVVLVYACFAIFGLSVEGKTGFLR